METKLNRKEKPEAIEVIEFLNELDAEERKEFLIHMGGVRLGIRISKTSLLFQTELLENKCNNN